MAEEGKRDLKNSNFGQENLELAQSITWGHLTNTLPHFVMGCFSKNYRNRISHLF